MRTGMVPPRTGRRQADGAFTHHEIGRGLVSRPVGRGGAAQRRIVERSPAVAAQNLQGLRSKEEPMDLIWIIVIVLIVLALLGYFGRGRFR